MTRHFLRDDDLSPDELLEVLDLADAMKAAPFDHKPLAGPQTVALVFDRPTLRTQVSFVGTSTLYGELDLADALDLETALAHGAAVLATCGSTESVATR